MRTEKITKNIKAFKKVEQEYDLITRRKEGCDPTKILPSLLFTKREHKKDVLSTKQVFGEGMCSQRIVLSEKFLNKFSPDILDSGVFWKKAVDIYPILSIAGNVDTDSEEQANASTLHGLAAQLKGLDITRFYWEQNKEDFKILEIGPGYGGFYDWVINLPNTKYYGLDVNPLFKCDTLYKGDGRNIPSEIPLGLDLVYSFNVFQHLSKSQRTSYYKQIYEILKTGGVFTFCNFVVTPNNFDKHFWGFSDDKNNYYAAFFNQFTKIDKQQELIDELTYIGFDVHIVKEHQNICSFMAIKK